MGAPKHILLVEDENNLGATLQDWLQRLGYLTDWVTTAHAAQTQLQLRAYDLALLDVGLPDGTGFEIATLCRRRSPPTAVIFLTARGLPADRVRGLELGAADYVVKPFHLPELKIRIRNALRAMPAVPPTMRLGQAILDFSRQTAEVNGQIHALSVKEVAILRLLVTRSGQVVSRDEILDEAWAADLYPTPRTVDNFIGRLRRLIEVSPEHPLIIRSVRGTGYQLLFEEMPA